VIDVELHVVLIAEIKEDRALCAIDISLPVLVVDEKSLFVGANRLV
jgi:hypothetical protein